MNSPLPPWPALSLEAPLPAELVFEAGVWGKIDGAASDYRWIATSPGLSTEHPQLARKLYLGSEDRPRPGFLWRTLEPGGADGGALHAVVVCTPSRAQDGAGRSSFLDKTVLLWRRPAQAPAALGTLLLTPRAVALATAVPGAEKGAFWEDPAPESSSGDDGPRPGFGGEELQPVPVSGGVITQAVEAGLAGLASALTQNELTELYSALLAGRRPAVLRELDQELPPEALGALLLPLPRSLADHLSIAGAVPSSRFHRKRLAEAWDVVALDDPPQEWVTGGAQPSSAQRKKAESFARAVLDRNPAGLASFTTAGSKADSDADDAVQIALWGPSASGKTALLAQLFLQAGSEEGDWEVYPTAESLKFIEQMRRKSRRESRFPTATPVGEGEPILYRFQHKIDGRSAVLFVEDRAGKDSEGLADGIRRRLESADGLILLFDPERDGALLETEVTRALDWMHVASGRSGSRDERPVAVCLSKADLRIHGAADLTRAERDPDGFVRSELDASLVRSLDRFLGRYRLFPVSAVGLKRLWGTVEPVVFYDETLTPRLCSGGRPLHLMAPFAWLFDEIGQTGGVS